jgi:hypothetical protein
VLARLKAYDPQHGYVLRRYTIAGLRFDAGGAWQEVDKRMGERLRAIHAVANDGSSPLTFEVVGTAKEAEAISASEAAKKKTAAAAKAAAAAPTEAGDEGILTLKDIPKLSARTSAGRRAAQRGR